MRKQPVFVLLCMWLQLLFLPCAAENESPGNEVYVLLGTENALLPLCISNMDTAKATLSKSHLNQLQDILTFDLSHNGMTKAIIGDSRKKILQGQPENISELPNLDLLRNTAISYFVQIGCTDKTLQTKLFSIQANSVQKVNIELTGTLSEDRVIMHTLADAILDALFHKKGIATSKILFTTKYRSGPQKGCSELFECDYDGGNVRQITSQKSLITCPQWIPSRSGTQGNALLYVSYLIGQPKLYYSSLNGAKPKRLTTMRGNQLTPAISPDGSLIAFASDITGTSDIFIVTFQKEVGSIGKPRHVFQAKGAACASPCFSPDGKKLCFVCNMDGSPKIYAIDVPEPGAALGSIKPKLISKRCKENTAPSWSPDGKKLAYSAKNSSERQIWIYDFETGSEKQLTKGPGHKENPSWATNSMHIVYNSAGLKNEIFLINLNQTEPTRIIQSPDDVQFAVFEPNLIRDEKKDHTHEVEI